MHDNHLSRHAQQVLTVTQGKSHLHGPGSDPSIARSWLRCLEDYHLDPALTMAPTVLEHGRVLADLPVAEFFGGNTLQAHYPAAHLFVKGELV